MANFATPTPNAIYPAVSVIIPLYNAEKYLNDCLDSILAQTFKDFEVIVVDDCSTDNSFAIAESYVEKFGGRLTLTRLQKNSGNAGYTARNKGFTFSRGEYVYFMDADDFIAETALEELYTAAKNFDADVVHTGARYQYTSDKGIVLSLDRIATEHRSKNAEDKPTLTINDPYENSILLNMERYFFTASWTKFVRKNFLTENEIVFPEIKSAGDVIWTIELFACVKRFLRIPNAVYFWRMDSLESITHKRRALEQQILLWCSTFISGAKYISSLLKRHDEIFSQYPNYQRFIWGYFFNSCFRHTFEARLQVTSDKIYDILRREFESKDDFGLMIPFFFSLIDSNQKNLLLSQQEINKLSETVAQDKKRIAELERRDKENKAYISELEKFIVELNRKEG